MREAHSHHHPSHRSPTTVGPKGTIAADAIGAETPGSSATPPRAAKSRPPRTTPKRWAAAAAAAAASANDHQSTGGHSSTPSSVLIHRVLLTRDLSDLSGSYAGRTCVTNSSSASQSHQQCPRPLREVFTGHEEGGADDDGGHRPGGVGSSPLSGVRPSRIGVGGGGGDDALQQSPSSCWAQARILSPREPTHPQPQSSGDSVSLGLAAARRGAGRTGRLSPQPSRNPHNAIASTRDRKSANKNQAPAEPFLVVEANSVELIEHTEDGSDQRRIPLIILLMDPSRKLYELAQLWVDQVEDSVRDVLHAIQDQLRDKPSWKTDYDGLFQVRNHSYSQLIHILDVHRYDAQPYELWVAKPWSMSAKATVSYAAGAIQRLKEMSVLKHQAPNPHRRPLPGVRVGGDESLLVLSPEARSRIYAPEGVLKHYHACQFLSFSPSMEPPAVPTRTIRVDVLGTDAYSEDGCSQLSDSHYYAASNDGGGMSVDSSSGNRALLNGSQAGSRPSTIPSTPSLRRALSKTNADTTNPSSRHHAVSIKSASPSGRELADLESNAQKSPASSRVVHAFSLLNCGGCKRDPPDDLKTLADPTLLDATTVGLTAGGPTWRAAWEEELSVVHSVGHQSVQSERAPLLQHRGAMSSRSWRFEI